MLKHYDEWCSALPIRIGQPAVRPGDTPRGTSKWIRTMAARNGMVPWPRASGKERGALAGHTSRRRSDDPRRRDCPNREPNGVVQDPIEIVSLFTASTTQGTSRIDSYFEIFGQPCVYTTAGTRHIHRAAWEQLPRRPLERILAIYDTRSDFSLRSISPRITRRS